MASSNNVSELNKVYSERKRRDVIAVLHDSHPSHDKRLWLVGFLQFVGYSESSILEIIKNHNRWGDYDKHETKRQVHYAVNRRKKLKEWYESKKPQSDNGFSVSKRGNKAEIVAKIPNQSALDEIFDKTEYESVKNASDNDKTEHAEGTAKRSRHADNDGNGRGVACIHESVSPLGSGGFGALSNSDYELQYCGLNPVHVKEILEEIDKNGGKGHNKQDKPGFSMNCECCMRPKCIDSSKRLGGKK